MNRKPTTGNVLKQLPTKWAVALVLCLIGYSVAQPFVNSKLGWSLPSLASLSGQGDDAKADDRSTQTQRDEKSDSEGRDRADDSRAVRDAKQSGSSGDSADRTSSNTNTTRGDSALSKDTRSERGPPSSTSGKDKTDSRPSNSDLRYGLLKDLGGENYLSPAGLRYTKGSEEGHRLKHIERHLEDQPSRPSPHGVFYGDMAQVIRWIDDAFERSEQGAKGTKKKKDRGRVVIEASFGKPIGYVGGAVGKRKGNPDAKSLRLVLDGDRVITAFPF